MNENNFYNNDNQNNNDSYYKHSKISNNPNALHEEINPEIDGGLFDDNGEKKNYIKNKDNWDISTNMEKDDNNINNENNIDNENNINNEKKEYNNKEKNSLGEEEEI